MDVGEKRCRIKDWTINVLVKIEREARPNNVTQFTYRQEIIDNTLVWVSAFDLTLDGVTTPYELWTKFDAGHLMLEIRRYGNPS